MGSNQEVLIAKKHEKEQKKEYLEFSPIMKSDSTELAARISSKEIWGLN